MVAVIIHVQTVEQNLAYFITVLGILKNHHATMKLNKCEWFQDKYEFVVMYTADVGTQASKSKNDAFYKLEKLNTWVYLCILIVIFR